jgi:hypothetical protein
MPACATRDRMFANVPRADAERDARTVATLGRRRKCLHVCVADHDLDQLTGRYRASIKPARRPAPGRRRAGLLVGQAIAEINSLRPGLPLVRRTRPGGDSQRSVLDDGSPPASPCPSTTAEAHEWGHRGRPQSEGSAARGALEAAVRPATCAAPEAEAVDFADSSEGGCPLGSLPGAGRRLAYRGGKRSPRHPGGVA